VKRCSFVGCKAAAVLVLSSTISPAVTACCDQHAPAWAKNGTQSMFAQKHGREVFTVTKIGGAK